AASGSRSLPSFGGLSGSASVLAAEMVIVREIPTIRSRSIGTAAAISSAAISGVEEAAVCPTGVAEVATAISVHEAGRRPAMPEALNGDDRNQHDCGERQHDWECESH